VWAAPALVDPVTMVVSAEHSKLRLQPDRDYRITMPSSPLSVRGGLVIEGGRNVVLAGGLIEIPQQAADASGEDRRGLYLTNQTGVVHIQDLRIGGPDLSEGIDLAEPHASAVQLQNIRIDNVHNRPDEPFEGGQHPDLVQMWSGNKKLQLRIDRLTGTTDYQGIFLTPSQYGEPIATADIRHVNIKPSNIQDLPHTRYLLWRENTFPLTLTAVMIQPQPGRRCPTDLVWPNPNAWPAVQCTAP
jgi:hypothetical protein